MAFSRQQQEIFDKIRQVLRFLVDRLPPWIAMGGRDDPVQRGGSVQSQQLYLKMMLLCTLRDAKNERGCGTCFWTMSENACACRDLGYSLRRPGIFNQAGCY